MDIKKEDCRKPIILCMAILKEPVNDGYEFCTYHEPQEADFPDWPGDYCKYCSLEETSGGMSAWVCGYREGEA
jgi:hypothetical protein